MNDAHARSHSSTSSARAAVLGPYAYGESLRWFANSEFSASDPRSSSPRLLDACCGSGELAMLFLDSGWDVVGLDPSDNLLTSARNVCEASVAGGSFTTASDPFALPHEPAAFELVVALDDTDVHLGSLDDLMSFLQQSYVALRVGGHVVFRLVELENAPTTSLILAMMRDVGFLASWLASPPFPEEPVVNPPQPFRGIYVGRRDI